jgi:hypothetical protein
MPPVLTEADAARFVALALDNVTTEYPFLATVLMAGDADALPPRRLHPVFFGSYDWHSCVHMHWTLARCLRRFPQMQAAPSVAAHFDRRLTPSAVAGELAFFNAPGRASFERPYGWGWLLKLQAELLALAQQDARAARWRQALAPLVEEVVARLLDFMPRQTYPVRAGTHGNTALALTLALDHAHAVQHRALIQSITRRAHDWFGRDARYPAHVEPGGDDFLSGGLVEAALMARLIDNCDFADWWLQFRPRDLAPWLTPASVSNGNDAKIVHLHGLNLSRAWCWKALLPILSDEDRPAVEAAIDAHLRASLPSVGADAYVGRHWLASFALLALDENT